MRGTIAWTRLFIYLGSSILLLVEIYRLSLILLRLVIIAPPLMAFLQNIVQWGLLLGFSVFTLGLFRILRTHPPVLDFEKFSNDNIYTWSRINLAISIILIILTLLPPTRLVTTGTFVIFSSLVSLSWVFFYALLVTWIILYWMLILKETSFMKIVLNRRILIHLFLGILIVFYWFLELVSLIIFQEAISSIDLMNISYIILLSLFLFNQILLYYKTTKFSYEIYG